MGMSNGGMMTFRLAAELPQRFAAFSAVSSSMAAKNQCVAAQAPLSLLVISGDADPLVPYMGGEVRFLSTQSRGSVIGIEAATAFYRKLNGLAGKPAIALTLPHRDPEDKTSALRTVWGADPKRYQVELIRINGGGHVEPSKTQRVGSLYRALVGPQNGDFEAAEEAWAFFKDKARAH
jgi:polyhydroxybutyrate depolymerase